MEERKYLMRSGDYDWSKLGPIAADVFTYKCPMFSSMLGMFELEDAVGVASAARKARKPRRGQKKRKN
ncbi:hypothetical protein PR048_016994 [Dryococelus australis]|uniref:Uncharacterized protein n=1 Tax=Dryococelus australis TaxID=614101 RepID=A0ABQ9H893_9NEOP|nr:hypothetical protein PR048_016994 [Dryococelus australis]